MAYLLYGIVKEPAHDGAAMTGLKGQPVTFVDGHGLAAAVSELDCEEGTPTVAELLSYARVVQDMHCRQAIVPMRYGCFLKGIPAIVDVLKQRQQQYHSLLDELEGHVEMGIRLLTPKTEPPLQAKPAANGCTYLARQRVHYQMQQDTTQSRLGLIDIYLKAFSGLYARHRLETDVKKDAVILSLYFLTPQNAIGRFREVFGVVAENAVPKAMLSGPWPPYNFVAPDLAADKEQ